MDPRALFIVRTSIPVEKEEAFNRWYNEDHLVKALAAPGCLSGRRYRIIGTGGANLKSKVEGEERFRFMAIYEYESLAIREASLKTGRLDRMVAEFNATWPESERLWTSAIQIYPEPGK